MTPDHHLRLHVLVAGYIAMGASDDCALAAAAKMTKRIARALEDSGDNAVADARENEPTVPWEAVKARLDLAAAKPEPAEARLECDGCLTKVPLEEGDDAERRRHVDCPKGGRWRRVAAPGGSGGGEAELGAPHYPGAPRPPKPPVCKCGQRMHLYGDPPKFAACGNPQCDAPRIPWPPALPAPSAPGPGEAKACGHYSQRHVLYRSEWLRWCLECGALMLDGLWIEQDQAILRTARIAELEAAAAAREELAEIGRLCLAWYNDACPKTTAELMSRIAAYLAKHPEAKETRP